MRLCFSIFTSGQSNLQFAKRYLFINTLSITMKSHLYNRADLAIIAHNINEVKK